MGHVEKPSHEAVAALVIGGIRELLAQRNSSPTSELTEETLLLGRASLLDSLGIVTLVVDLEERIAQEYDIILTLADERAMSQRHSPFRTVRSLTEYICSLIAEER